MRPLTDENPNTQRPSFRMSFRTALKVLGICLISASVPAAVYVRVSSKDSGSLKKSMADQVTVRAAGRGKPFLNLRDGRGTSVNYRGASELASALQSGAAQPRSLASADFDRNGTPDVIAGYSFNGAGMITLRHGNPDAFAPSDDSVFTRIQQGYDPASLLPNADVYAVPVSPDFLVTGDFNHDSSKDILFAAKGGRLFLMTGNGLGRIDDPQPIDLPGTVTALAAGEFRAADGFTDVAVGVAGQGGDSLLIFDGANGWSEPLMRYSLSSAATAIDFGGLDDDPFLDVAVTAGDEVVLVHGWGRKRQVQEAASRVERITVGSNLRGIAVGEFAWDRQGQSEIAALSDDGTVHIVTDSKSDTRPFTEAEAAQRTRGKLRAQPGRASVDVEAVPGWQPGNSEGWAEARSFSASSFSGVSSASTKPLMRTNLSYRETDDLLLMGQSQSKIEVVHPLSPRDKALSQSADSPDLARTTLDVESAPVAVLALPKKLNGVSDVVVLNSTSDELSIVPSAPNTTITVDRTDDPSGAGLTAASACTAAANDCSLRGALQFANNPANNNTTISLPANTYILSINGTGAVGCDGNTVGDLGANQTMSITGAGSATTIIRQTGTGPANDGDRVMCMNEPFTLNLVYNFSGFTMVGGRDGTAAGTGSAIGGGGIIGGEKGNVLTLTNVVLANNQVTVLGSGNIGGGGIQWTGGDMNVTNSTFGGSAAPGAYTDRTSTNTANLQAGSGGGVMFTPSAPTHTASTGILTVAGSTFSRNTAGSIGSGGGGADLLNFAFAAPGGFGSGSATIGTSTFSNNAANPGNGGGILVESLATTVATSSFTSNSAGNLGGAIYLGGGSLILNGTTPSITFTSNTATNGGSGIGVNVGIDQDGGGNRTINATGGVQLQGTNTNLSGHDIYVATNGAWTNTPGSAMTIGNLILDSGNNPCGGCVNALMAAFKANNTTSTLTGNWTITGGTFVGDTGTVNVAGNFSFNLASGHGAFTAGSSTVNFNGAGSQSISNGTSITFFNLTDSNITNPLTLNNSLAVNGSLNVNGANAILAPAAGAVISGTGTLTGTGTARATRIAATPDFLTQYSITNKTLTNLTIDYIGAGNQTVNNAPAYSHLRISGTGTKTLQGNTAISGDLTIAAAALDASASNFNFDLGRNWTNSVGAAGFVPRSGTVNFVGNGVVQTLSGTTTFFNLTLNNPSSLTDFASTTTTIQNNLVASAGSMQGNTSTIIFTGASGSISGAATKQFNNLQINAGANISNPTGGNITILNDLTNNGTFTQAAGLTTTFTNGADGIHSLSGAGTSTFGLFTINGGNTVNSSPNFNVVGAAFTANGNFSATSGTTTFSGAVPQTLVGDGTKSFSGLTINNANGVSLANGTGAVDGSVSGLLTLSTDFTVAAGGVLQQSGTSAGVADVIGTVRRTDLGAVERAFGNLNNTITVNTGTAPTQLDFNLVKAAPPTFPSTVKVVPRDYTLTPTGGAGISATLKLRYIDPAELATVTESRLVLWKNIAGTWTPQGGSVNAASNFVSLSGVSSFSEWAIAEASDLTLSKANNVSGSAVVGQAWNWTLTASNAGAPATFTAGQTILSDNLPNSNVSYGTPTVQNATNITGSANISCSIVSNDLTCTANGGSVTFDSDLGASSFEVVFSATAQAVGTYQNPRTGGGVAQIDPGNVIVESNEANNSPTANSVTVAKANTTTTISSDLPDPSVVGQAVTVQWSVTVNSPGSTGAALTGNVTVSDGTNQCVATVSAGQCDVTFTSAGSKNLTATYAGDTNYNGSASSPATAHTVNKADTTTSITSDNPDPSTPGQSVTVQWTVTPTSPGSGTPSGTVTVTVSGGAETCNAPVASGQCSLTLNIGGPRTITATYGGDSNFNGSADTEDHTVCASSLVTSTADSGAGSLRQIIADACDNATITFDSAGVFATPQTITLTTGEILIDKNLTINAGSNQITLSGNNASRIFHINTGRTVSVIGFTISGGSSANDGGATLNDGTLTIVNSTLSGNTALNGGAISSSATATSLTLINTTISGNTASVNGGGIVVGGGTASIINATITNNSADSDNNSTGTGGGLHVQAGTVTLKNTIVAGNFNEDGASDAADDISGTVDASSSFNLIGTGGAGGLTNGVNNNQVGVASPGLGPLANNGGKTSTHELLPTSLAIETGSNANLPTDAFDLDGDANTAETLPVDQRNVGFPRVADSSDANTIQTVDIGAYEAHPTIEDIANQSTNQDTVKNVSFNLGDDTGALINTVTATSSNTTLVPNANLIFSGSGGSRNLQITPAAGQSGITTITVTVTATNGRTATDTFDLTVVPPNASPIVTTTGGNLAYTENDPATAIDPGLTVTDSDNANLTGATVAITAGFVSAQDTLAFTNQLGITGSYNIGTGVLTLTGTTTVANYQAALRTVTYANSSDNPTASRTITFTTTDGISIPGSATRGIAITAVNDGPVNTVPGPQTTNEDTAKVFSSGNGNQISVADVDLGANAIKVTLTATNGTLTLASTAGLSFTTGDGTADATMVFTGLLANVNTALNGISFTPTQDFNGAASVQIVSDDQGNTGTGGPLTDTDTVNITVNTQNDAPVVTTTGGNLTYNENAAATAIDPGLTVTDVDNANLTGATVAITGNFASSEDVLAFTNQLGITGSYNSGTGVLTLTGTTTVANYQTALRSVTYQNTSDNPSTSTRTVTFTANDGTDTGSATRGITVTAVNDPPVNTVPASQGTAQNTPLVFSSGNSNQIAVADPDAGSNSIQVTLTATNGTLTLSGTSGLSFTMGDGTADATMTFSGTIANINTALNGLTYTPTLGFSGAASLTITSNDQGNTGTGGPLSDTDVVNIQVQLNMSVQDAQVTEPSSGFVNMIFTVTLNAPAPAGGASVDFTTQDQPPALNHATAGQDYTTTAGTVNFGVGEQVKAIQVPVLSDSFTSESNETFLLILANPVNATITDGTATGTILVTGQPGTILISELRTSGPAGAGDDFVEIYNNSDSPLTVNDASGGYGLFKMGADCNANPVLIGVIPNGTVIPARGNYLFVGSAYSLANYGGTGAAAGDQILIQDIENDRNVGLFSTTSLANLSSLTRLDAVGFDGNINGVCALLSEGTTLPPLAGSTLEYSYFRDECGKKGNPATFGPCPTSGFMADTNVNGNDFIFADTAGSVTPAGQHLGAPAPQNIGSAVLNSQIPALLVDSTIAAPTAPNRVRDFTPVANGANGTLSIRRRFINNTGAPVTRLRFRIVDFSSLTNNPIADLRALSSVNVTVNGILDGATCAATGTPATAPCSVTVFGTTLETPPAQAIGGALNSSLSAGTITVPTPLQPGASINLQFLLGVQQPGSFKFFFNIEALPSSGNPPIPNNPLKPTKSSIQRKK